MEAKIKKMTVIDLRTELGKRNLPKTGLKAELVSRLLEAMNKAEDTSDKENDENAPPSNIPEKRSTKRGRKPVSKKTEDDDEIEEEKPAEKPKAKKGRKPAARSKRKVQKESDSEEENREEEPKEQEDAKEEDSTEQDAAPREEEREERMAVEEPRIERVEETIESTATFVAPTQEVAQPSSSQAAVSETPREPVRAERVPEAPAKVQTIVEREITEVPEPRAVEEVTVKTSSGVLSFFRSVSKPAEIQAPIEPTPQAVAPITEPRAVLKPSVTSTIREHQAETLPPVQASTTFSRNSLTRISVQELAKYVNPILLEKAIDTVCNQVNPMLKISTSGLKLIRNYILYLVERLLNGGAVKRDQNDKRTLTSKSMEAAVTLLYRNELAKHAVSEGLKAIQKYNARSKEEGEIDDSLLVNAAGLVFPTHLFQGLILNGRFVSEPKYLQEEALIFLSASMEYFTAELLELSIDFALEHNERETNLTAQHIIASLAKDEELNNLLKGYTCPVNEQQRSAMNIWKSKLAELLDIFSQLPAEEFCQVPKYVTDQMNILDATYSSKEILERYAQDVPSEDLSMEIRRLSKCVTIRDVQLDEQDFGTSFPRTKTAHFIMSLPNSTQVLNFFYSSQTVDIHRGATIEISVSATGRPDLEGVLWAFYENESDQRVINNPLLSALRHAFGCHPSFGNKQFVRFLLSLCEAETGGGISIILRELEEMDYAGLFTDDSLSNSLLSSPSQEEQYELSY